jgi:hypothetical protein
MRTLRFTFGTISIALAAVVLQSPVAGAATVRGLEYEGSFMSSQSDFTDCPAAPTSLPFDCSAVTVITFGAIETAGRTTVRSSTGYITAYHVHLTGPGVFTAAPFAFGQGPIAIDQDGLRAESLKGTVALDDGSSVALAYSAKAVGAPTAYSGSTTYPNAICPSGTLSASWRGRYADASIKGGVALNGTAMVQTSAASTPRISAEQDHGTCAP